MENIKINFNPKGDDLASILFNGEDNEKINYFMANTLTSIGNKLESGEELTDDEKKILTTTYVSLLNSDTVVSLCGVMLPDLKYDTMGEFVEHLASTADTTAFKKMASYINYKVMNLRDGEE